MTLSAVLKTCVATLVSLYLMLPVPGMAQNGPMPALTQTERAKWGAVGRVNQAGFRKLRACTGTLIAPDLVLTAAHCVFRASKAATVVHFIAGWDRGNRRAHRIASQILVHPRYKDDGTTLSLSHDVAVMRLESAIPGDVLAPLPLMKPARGTLAPDLVLGYHNRRPHVLNGSNACGLQNFDPRGLVFLDCMVIGGNSGGPVMTRRSQGWSVSAVIVAQGNDPKGAIAVPVDDWLLRQWRSAQKRESNGR